MDTDDISFDGTWVAMVADGSSAYIDGTFTLNEEPGTFRRGIAKLARLFLFLPCLLSRKLSMNHLYLTNERLCGAGRLPVLERRGVSELVVS